MGLALDVLICTCERPDHVLRAVTDVLEQLGPTDGVLVYDQSLRVQPTRDALAALEDARVKHIPGPRLGLPTARNAALALTSRPLVVFFDDDVRLEPGCLEAHRSALMEEGVGGTVGAIDDRGQVWNARRTRADVDASGRVRARLDGDRAVDVGSVKGCNMGFRRAALEEVGGFDAGYRGTALLEETDASEKLRKQGYRLCFVPEARLIHLAAPAGGVRVGSPHRTEWWRFHNTARFVARHRPGSVPVAGATHALIAIKRAIDWRDPRAPLTLMRAFMTGAWGARDMEVR